jgi:hypothetical protein
MHISVKKEVEAKYLDLDVAVRYNDEDMAYDAPLRDGKSWKAVINLDEGRIENWPQGETLSFHDMKICDEDIYILLDADKKEITRIEGYVPNSLLPGEYGDYLDMDIDETGKITNWLTNASLEDFEADSE